MSEVDALSGNLVHESGGDCCDSPVPRYWPALDGVRAIAVAMVILLHCVVVPEQGGFAWFVKHTLSNGWIGVDLFFVLSGFLITGILLREKSRPDYFRRFYWRRALRIFPAYYFLLTVLYFFSTDMGLTKMSPAWPLFTYSSNLMSIAHFGYWAPMAHSWSLAIEEQFYLVFPIVVLLLTKDALRKLLIVILIATPLVRLAFNMQQVEGASYFLTICRLDVLSMGALLAIWVSNRDPETLSSPRWLTPAIFACFPLVLSLWLTKQLDFNKPMFNLLGLTIVDGFLALLVFFTVVSRGSRIVEVLSSKGMVGVGKISYGLYLYHFPIFYIVKGSFVGRLGDGWTKTGAIFLVTVFATFVVAYASWRFLESSFLKLKSRRFGKKFRYASL